MATGTIMNAVFDEIRKLLKETPDIPNKRRISTHLNDLEEQLNIVLGIVARTQGYTFDAGIGRSHVEQDPNRKNQKDGVGPNAGNEGFPPI